jgi:PhzF family phenazine biosynthesis protein
MHRFHQVDVFGRTAYQGNPVAVVHDADGMTVRRMQQIARWTNLSETTFLLAPTTADADYRVRIFTPSEELPFAGHPTLGSCHAWSEQNGGRDRLVQECTAGLVEVRRSDDGWAFAAPPLVRSGRVEEEDLQRIATVLGISAPDIVDAAWVDNGPGWVAVLLRDAEAVLAVRPGHLGGYFVGVVGAPDPGADYDLEVRAFFDVDGATVEDPVTGSLNASVAQWLGERIGVPYTARQGRAAGRDGVVRISRDAAGTVWVAGATRTCVAGVLHEPRA